MFCCDNKKIAPRPDRDQSPGTRVRATGSAHAGGRRLSFGRLTSLVKESQKKNVNRNNSVLVPSKLPARLSLITPRLLSIGNLIPPSGSFVRYFASSIQIHTSDGLVARNKQSQIAFTGISASLLVRALWKSSTINPSQRTFLDRWVERQNAQKMPLNKKIPKS